MAKFAVGDVVCMDREEYAKNFFYLRPAQVLSANDHVVKVEYDNNNVMWWPVDCLMHYPHPQSSEPPAQPELFDDITAPAHYKQGRRYEVIDVLDDWFNGGRPGDFHKATAVAYIARAGLKADDPEIKDLKKAKWYLERRIAQLETTTVVNQEADASKPTK